MDAAVEFSRYRRAGRRPILSVAARHHAELLVSALMLVLAVFVFTRRATGVLSAPLTSGAFIAVSLVIATAAWAIHLLHPPASSRQDATASDRSTVGQWFAALCCPIFALSISLPGSSTWGLMILWLAVIGAEYVICWLRHVAPQVASAPNVTEQFREPQVRLIESLPQYLQNTTLIPPPPADLATATQSLVYHRSADGTISIEGWLKVSFAAEQRISIVHVAFCPAFEKVPLVETELQDGPSCEIRPTLVLAWGVRWEVKLDSPATSPATATIEFIAREDR